MKKEQKYRSFFKRVYPKVLHFAQATLQSREDAEDIVQDVFLKLWEHPEYWEESEIADSFIYTMTKNSVYNFIRHKKIEEKYAQTCAAQENLSESIDDQIIAKEVDVHLHQAIENLTPQRKKVLQLNKIEGHSVQDVADLLSLSKRTVERHLMLAISDLKKFF